MDEQRFTDREEQKRNLRRSMIVNSQEEEEASGKDYEENLRRHRRKRIRVIAVMAAVILVLGGVGLYFYFHRSYDRLEVLWTQSVEAGSYEGAVPFGSGIVKYGRDAASYIDGSGTVIWTESYEMSHPLVVTRGEYIVLADQGANQMLICGESGKLGEVTTASPITRAALAAQGMTVVILEDSGANYLAFYDRTGKKLDIEIKTRLQGDGYPLDLALAPSGEQLMVSYVYVENGTLRNKVVFYNFDVGQDMVDRIVGGFEQYESTMIPRVTFLNESQAVAFGDNILSFYSLKNQLKPALVKEINIEEDIAAVFYNESYAGLVTRTENAQAPYRLRVYDGSGEVVLEKEISLQFTQIEFVDDEILLYNKDTIIIYDIAGGVKYTETLSAELSAIIPGSRKDTYILIGNGLMQAVELR